MNLKDPGFADFKLDDFDVPDTELETGVDPESGLSAEDLHAHGMRQMNELEREVRDGHEDVLNSFVRRVNPIPRARKPKTQRKPGSIAAKKEQDREFKIE